MSQILLRFICMFASNQSDKTSLVVPLLRMQKIQTEKCDHKKSPDAVRHFLCDNCSVTAALQQEANMCSFDTSSDFHPWESLWSPCLSKTKATDEI